MVQFNKANYVLMRTLTHHWQVFRTCIIKKNVIKRIWHVLQITFIRLNFIKHQKGVFSANGAKFQFKTNHIFIDISP